MGRKCTRAHQERLSLKHSSRRECGDWLQPSKAMYASNSMPPHVDIQRLVSGILIWFPFKGEWCEQSSKLCRLCLLGSRASFMSKLTQLSWEMNLLMCWQKLHHGHWMCLQDMGRKGALSLSVTKAQMISKTCGKGLLCGYWVCGKGSGDGKGAAIASHV